LYAAHDDGLVDEMESLLPADPAYLVELAKTRFAAADQDRVRVVLLRRASRDIEQMSDSAQRHYLLGAIELLTDRAGAAVEHLTKAVQLCPEQTSWRYDLALALQKHGDLPAARAQAGLCLSQDPRNESYEQLLRKLVRSELTSDATGQ
jgi:Flp pilus assembly protein TadD